MSRRLVINLVAFAVVGVLLAIWALTNVVTIDAVTRPSTVRAQFATSPGLSPHFEVTYLGQRIGAISRVALAGRGVDVTMKIDRGEPVPRAVDAAVRRKSAVGEPYVDLQPTAGTDPDVGPRLSNGDRIPLARTTTPLSYGDLFSAVDALVTAIPPADLRSLVHELAVGVDGRTDSLRELFTGLDQLTGDLSDHSALLDQTVGDVTRLTHTFADHGASIAASVDHLAALSETLRQSADNVAALLQRGPALGTRVDRLLSSAGGDLGCALDSLGAVGSKLDPPTVSALAHVIDKSPKFLFVLQGLETDYGLHGRLGVNLGPTGPVAYDKPLTPPTVPPVPACSPTAQGTRGQPGAQGSAPASAGPATAPAATPPVVRARPVHAGPPPPAAMPSAPTSLPHGLRLSDRVLVVAGVVVALALASAATTMRRRNRSLPPEQEVT